MILVHILRFLAKTLFNLIISIVIRLLGIPIVAIALLFGTVDTPGTEMPFTKSKMGNWVLRRLKKPFLLWDNAFDGMLGDRGGAWNRECITKYGKLSSEFYCMWFWAAIRNPANYFSRNIMGIDVTECDFTLLGGAEDVSEKLHGWQFILAKHKVSKKHYYLLEFSYPWWFDQNKVFYGIFGYKLKMSHANVFPSAEERNRKVGLAFRINPFKQINR